MGFLQSWPWRRAAAPAVAAPRKGITGHDTPAEHSGLALPPPTAPACPPARRVHRGCAGNPRPGLPTVRSAIEMRRVARPGEIAVVSTWAAERPLGLFAPMGETLAELGVAEPYPRAFDPDSYRRAESALRRRAVCATG
jgi:hypothetical protein